MSGQTDTSAQADERRSLDRARREHDEAMAIAHAERDVARRAERQARAALDRALEQLESLRSDVSGGVDGEVMGLAGIESAGGRADPAARRALAEARDERKARIAIEQSFSWRVTAPLRAAKGVLAGPRERLRTLAAQRRRGGA